eukprot:7839136-Heterocapsa_arctica.AAC.1
MRRRTALSSTSTSTSAGRETWICTRSSRKDKHEPQRRFSITYVSSTMAPCVRAPEDDTLPQVRSGRSRRASP